MTNEEREKHLDWLYRLKREIFVFMPIDWLIPFADALDVAIKVLEQEPIDYKTQYENYLKKSEVVISQLRADRDRLQDAFDKLRAEIEEPLKINQGLNTESAKAQAIALSWVLEVIDKYKAEIEPQESEG